jgi:anti-sigma regulatory factor (Ser/Thr protein kinase)
MDALLIDAWTAGVAAVPTRDEASVSAAREAVRERGREIGLPHEVVERVALAASELVTNQLVHARSGCFGVRAVARGGVPGLEIVAADGGRGIDDPARALAGPGPSKRSLGAGLAAARRATDELDVDVRAGEGTCVRARAFATPLPRGREVGILSRPLDKEPVSGDHAVVLRDGAVLLVAVIDGIGHGEAARDASDRAVAAVLDRGSAHPVTPHPTLLRSPSAVLHACHAALTGSRGAVMSAARVDDDAGHVEHAGAGNVTTRIDGFDRSKRFGASAATLGARGTKLRVVAETAAFERGDALVMFTDGLASRASLTETRHLLHEHPIVIAQRLMETFGRATDDALVLVVR